MLRPPQFMSRILVATDFSPASERAFFHALAFAVHQRARLTLLHTGTESRHAVPWEQFPSVRSTLAAWGLLPPDVERNAVAERLGVSVAKMAMRDEDPRAGIADYLHKHPVDLLVMATEGRRGLARLFDPSVAETVTYQTRSHALLLPIQCHGFVGQADGRSSLTRVLFAPDPGQDLQSAFAYLRIWLDAFRGDNPVEITVLYTGEADESAQPAFLPNAAGQTWREETRDGDPLGSVIEAARDLDVGMVAIHTHGPLGLRGRLRGSRTDQLLRLLQVPLLSMPGA